MPIFFDALLYFTAFGEILVLFASAVWIMIWLVKRVWSWVTAEPENSASRPREYYSQNLDYLKRAGQ